jgi:hypothetical protein
MSKPATVHLKALKAALNKLESDDHELPDDEMSGLEDFYDFLSEDKGAKFEIGPFKLKLLHSKLDFSDHEEPIHQAVFESDDFLFALDGFYSSYEGTEWDEINELYHVVPKQVITTVYEAP